MQKIPDRTSMKNKASSRSVLVDGYDSSNVSTERLYERLSQNLSKCKVIEAGKTALKSHAAAKVLK
jgi:hypothetical protein